MQMSVSATTNTTNSSTSSSSSSSSTGSTGMDRDAFLKLLVTQLQNQDPTKPLDDTAFVSQLAQYSSLEQMTNMSEGLTTLSQMQLTNQALSLVGRTVELNNASGGANITGKVESIKFESGVPVLVVGGKEYQLADVLSVKE